MNQATPMITVYRPIQEGSRWLARADVVAGGELIQLQATASEALAKRAKGWYNQAAEWVSKWIQYDGGAPERLGVGAFGDMPVVAYETAKAVQALPARDPVMQAAQEIYVSADAGDPAALSHLEQVRELAATNEPQAVRLHQALCLIHDAMQAGIVEGFGFGPVIAGAANGDRGALGMFAALRTLSPAQPARIQYSVDEYCACGDGCEAMSGDVIGASLFELTTPRKRTVHRVVPGRYRPAIEALRAIDRSQRPQPPQPIRGEREFRGDYVGAY